MAQQEKPGIAKLVIGSFFPVDLTLAKEELGDRGEAQSEPKEAMKFPFFRSKDTTMAGSAICIPLCAFVGFARPRWLTLGNFSARRTLP